MEGGTTFHFVTDGIEAALEQAKAAAGGKDVRLGGGAEVMQQYLAAGLLDELQIRIAPVLLGGGGGLFEADLGDAEFGARGRGAAMEAPACRCARAVPAS